MEERHLSQLRKLYPKLSDDELAKAQERLDQYLLLAWEVFEEHGFDLPDANLLKDKSILKRVDSIYRKFDSSPGSS